MTAAEGRVAGDGAMTTAKEQHMAKLAEAARKLGAVRTLIDNRLFISEPGWSHVATDDRLVELLDCILRECRGDD
jgi:hypothetical protein